MRNTNYKNSLEIIFLDESKNNDLSSGGSINNSETKTLEQIVSERKVSGQIKSDFQDLLDIIDGKKTVPNN